MTAAGIDATYIQGYANSITGIINGILVPVLISIAFIVFLWGIYKYFIKGASNESEKGEGRMFALYGIIGFVLLFSVWGIVQILMGTLNLSGSTNAPKPPTFGNSTSADSYNNGAGYNTMGGATSGGGSASGACTYTGTLNDPCTINCQCANGYTCYNNQFCIPVGGTANPSSSGTQTNGTICDYTEIGTADGTWLNGRCTQTCNDPGGC